MSFLSLTEADPEPRQQSNRGKEFNMTNLFARFIKNESGATAIEYGLIAALVAVAAIGGMTTLGTSLKTQFTDIGSALKGK